MAAVHELPPCEPRDSFLFACADQHSFNCPLICKELVLLHRMMDELESGPHGPYARRSADPVWQLLIANITNLILSIPMHPFFFFHPFLLYLAYIRTSLPLRHGDPDHPPVYHAYHRPAQRRAPRRHPRAAWRQSPAAVERGAGVDEGLHGRQIHDANGEARG
ncbi:hypothetical protein B0H19DRAFT_153041 [Mycena capillaripes]|nr:hypothetical protein B0H19DRAFT_153041 [Mycena capillaripes]